LLLFQWDALHRHTAPPYHLTYKSNGCLILISALSPTELLVASKHSLGTSVVPSPKIPDDKAEQKEKNDVLAKAIPGTEEYTKGKNSVEAQVEQLSLKDTTIQSVPKEEHSTEPETSNAGAEKSKKQQKRDDKKRAAEQVKAEKERSKLTSGGKPADGAQGEKHSGPNHAAMGRKWLKIHLERVGRQEKDLAAELWERKLSCILEVSF
jgi:tRNA ligase